MKVRVYELLGFVCAGEVLAAVYTGELLLLCGLVALSSLIVLGWILALSETVQG